MMASLVACDSTCQGVALSIRIPSNRYHPLEIFSSAIGAWEVIHIPVNVSVVHVLVTRNLEGLACEFRQ